MTSNPAMRGVVVEVDGSLEDLDRHADVLEGLGVYEATLERALLRSNLVPVTELLCKRLTQEGLTVR